MGNNLLFRYEWAKAEEFYQRALQMDPDSADIMEDYVTLLTDSGQLEEAQRVADRMLELDPRVPVFLNAMISVNDSAGDFELRDRNIKAALDINPDLPNIQGVNLLRLLQYGQVDEARAYARQMDSPQASTGDILQMLDWMSDAEREPGPGALATIADLPRAALLAGRHDIWLNALEQAGAVWPEWPLTGVEDLLAPIASPEVVHQYRADSRTKDFLQKLRLPEYWRKVGWPDMCQPIGTDDFECN
jgi:tetratricopeptide (TPR) repeat protein